MASESSTAALQRYSDFVEHVLRPQLQQTLAQRDALTQEVHEYQLLRELLPTLAQPSRSEPLQTLVDVGERFHVRATVADASLVSVDIGLDVYVEMTATEAQRFVHAHVRYLMRYDDGRRWRDEQQKEREK